MVQTTINIGTTAGAGDGESVRSGFMKVNQISADSYAHAQSTTNPHAVTTAQIGAVPTTLLGQPNGVATLGIDGRIASGQSPLTAAALTTGRVIAITGDATGSVMFDGSANATLTATLIMSGVAPGTFNSIIVNSKGLIVGGNTLAYLTSNQPVTLSGDVVGTGSTFVAVTLANTGVAAGTYGRAIVNAKGLISAVTTEYEIDALAHGVAGDGVTDDRAAFIAVLNLAAARAAAVGAPVNVILPSANYYFSSPIPLVSNIRLIGRGKPRITVGGSNGQIFTGTSLTYLTFENLTLDGGRTAGGAKSASTSVTCDFQTCGYVTFNNVDVINPSGGVHFTNCNNILVSDCSVTNSNGHGIYLKTSYDSEVRNCQFNALVYFGVICTAACYRIKIVGNRCASNGIELAASTQDCYEIHYMYNHAEATGDNGLSVGGHRNVVVGNVIKGCQGNGIHVYGDRCSIVGNTSLNNAQGGGHNSSWRAGIAIQNGFGGMSQFNTITGNVCDDDQATPTQFYGVWAGPNVYSIWSSGTVISAAGPFSPVYCYYGTNLYLTLANGTNGATPPTHTSGSVSDGGVTWTFVWTALAGAIGAFCNEISSNSVVRFGTAKYGDLSGGTGATANEISASFQPVVLPANLTAGVISNAGGLASVAFSGSYQTGSGSPITLAVAAPSVSGGQQATATVATYSVLGFGNIVSGGSGYAIGDLVSLPGGTCVGTPFTLKITAVSSGAATAFTFGSGSIIYSVLPPGGNVVATTSTGSGSGLTISPTQWHIASITTTAGSGYTSPPIVTSTGVTSGTLVLSATTSAQMILTAGGGNILLDNTGTRLGINGATGQPAIMDGALIDGSGVRLTLVSGTSLVIPANTSQVRLVQSGSIASGLITLPTAIHDGQTLEIINEGVAIGGSPIFSLTFSPAVNNYLAGSSLGVGQRIKLVWDATFGKWNNVYSPAPAQALNFQGRNLVHNGLFRVNQRAVASVTSAGQFPADRFNHGDNGAGTRTVSQVTLADADRTAIGEDFYTNALRIQTTGSSSAGDYEIIQHRMENARTTANKACVLSFWAKAATAGQPIATEVQQCFGTGGSPSANVTGLFQSKIALTTGWVRYFVSGTMNSTSGKTFGTTAGTDYIEIDFWTSSGSTYASRNSSIGVQTSDIQITGVQFEIADYPTPFERTPLSTDLLNCKRYFQNISCGAFSYGPAGTAAGQTITHSTPMRAIPSASVANVTYGNASGATAAPDTVTTFLYYTITSAGLAQIGGYVALDASL